MTLRIGMIGLGDIARKAYLPVLAPHRDVEITGIMSRSAETVEEIGRQYRIPGRFTDVQALLEQRPDAVFIHAPTEAHPLLVEACLAQRIPVYVDKPLSYDIAESIRLTELAEAKDTLLAVGFNRRFSPLYKEAKAWLEESGGFDLAVVQKHRTRQQQLKAKQTLYDDLIHIIDLLLWLQPDSSPKLASYRQESNEEGKLLHATGMLIAGESSSMFSMNRRAGEDLESLELHGGGRSVRIRNLEEAEWADRRTGNRTSGFGSWDSIGKRRGFEGAINHFLECLHDPGQCTLSARSVLDSHQWVERLADAGPNSG